MMEQDHRPGPGHHLHYTQPHYHAMVPPGPSLGVHPPPGHNKQLTLPPPSPLYNTHMLDSDRDTLSLPPPSPNISLYNNITQHHPRQQQQQQHQHPLQTQTSLDYGHCSKSEDAAVTKLINELQQQPMSTPITTFQSFNNFTQSSGIEF